MGSYLNPGSTMFRASIRSKIYVDKSELMTKINEFVNTEQKYVCVSRPRRFGKSMAMNMLAAYYDREENTEDIFDKLKISRASSYREHLNQYDVLKINMQDFLSISSDIDEMLRIFKEYLLHDLLKKYENISFVDKNNLAQVMRDICSSTGRSFVILIDEWDCLFREYQYDGEAQKKYLDFLRLWLKDKEYVALAYMTGILPVKKYGSHSALNMFMEYSMTDPGNLAEYFGFTGDEVKALCEEYQMSFEEAESWYDGYKLVSHHWQGNQEYSMYSPKSVVEAMLRHKFGTYWNQTETYEALKKYIQMDMDGLKQSVIEMLAGNSVRINTGTFSNDMTNFATKDDVLTLLVHLGYLTYDSDTESVMIPNKEVSQEYMNAISTMNWSGVIDAVETSRQLLEALWNMDEEAVAAGVELAHKENSILQYNDENSLSCTVNLAFYFAREYYTIIREYPTGKGFADICWIPKKQHMDKPAVIVELKWNKSASGALNQIIEKQYTEAFSDYRGNILLVGINYDRKSKTHTCKIEKVRKDM